MASSVASQVIMFIAVITITTGLVAVFNNYVHETTSSTRVQWQLMSNNLKTDVTITSMDYAADSPDNVTIYVMNTGKVKLDINQTDVYLDGFIPRDEASRTVSIEPSTDTIDAGIWNEKEVVKIVVFKDLTSSTTYEVCIATQYGTRTCDTFMTDS